jgi:hypothetical protein
MRIIRPTSLTKEQRRAFAVWLGRRSYQARLKRFGIERIREVARENGKRGGRPAVAAQYK